MTTSTPPYRKKLIEVALPLEAINKASVSEKSVPRRGHPQTIHLWWARRPLAAARSILVAQLLDDPSSWPELFPTEEAQDLERRRLFDLIGHLALWENANNKQVLAAVRREIVECWTRGTDSEHPIRERLREGCASETEVNKLLRELIPPILDPFTGGGTISVEAQRLGLRAHASDLNPVAVTINRALLDIPQRFKNQAPCHPTRQAELISTPWRGAAGLAEDVTEYSKTVLERAIARLSQYYDVLKSGEGQQDTVPIGWIWARTVASPNPAFKGAHVPLVASFWLCNKPGRESWIDTEVDKEKCEYKFTVRNGLPGPLIKGTVNRRGATCILSGDPIPFSHIRAEAQGGRMGARLMAIAVEGGASRVFLSPVSSSPPEPPEPADAPSTMLPDRALGFRVQKYGLVRHRDLFSRRQLLALCTFSDIIRDLWQEIVVHARARGLSEGDRLSEGGTGAQAYADAIVTYLTLGLGRLSDYNSTICTWNTIGGSIRSTFARHAMPIAWDFYETNPLADTTGSWSSCVSWVADVVRNIHADAPVTVEQRDAASAELPAGIVSTDPPYYDNIGYSDLSDFFYIWFRRTARSVFPSLFSTMLVPKAAELVATPYRFDGDDERAKQFFESGLLQAFTRLKEVQVNNVPLSIYYAFKQTETDDAAGDAEDADDTSDDQKVTASTGWEAFLRAVIDAGFMITGTWPVRSERKGRARDIKSNALASSVVLVCRKRPSDEVVITRGEFRRALREELPVAVQALKHGNIAPVDLAQAAIGPGMAIFSRHATVMEADGTPMSVRSALQLINEALDEYLSAQEGEADADTRFALTWFETNGWSVGSFGDAETLAKARNISVAGIVESGILHSAAGKVRLLKRSELPADWDPHQDTRVPVWEATQHLIRRLEEQGESGAAALHHQLGPLADHAHDLAYRLYSICERKSWAEDARAYNGLVTAWPEISRLSAAVAEAPPTAPGQIGLGLVGAEPPAPKKKPATRKSRKST